MASSVEAAYVGRGDAAKKLQPISQSRCPGPSVFVGASLPAHRDGAVAKKLAECSLSWGVTLHVVVLAFFCGNLFEIGSKKESV